MLIFAPTLNLSMSTLRNMLPLALVFNGDANASIPEAVVNPQAKTTDHFALAQDAINSFGKRCNALIANPDTHRQGTKVRQESHSTGYTYGSVVSTSQAEPEFCSCSSTYPNGEKDAGENLLCAYSSNGSIDFIAVVGVDEVSGVFEDSGKYVVSYGSVVASKMSSVSFVIDPIAKTAQLVQEDSEGLSVPKENIIYDKAWDIRNLGVKTVQSIADELQPDYMIMLGSDGRIIEGWEDSK